MKISSLVSFIAILLTFVFCGIYLSENENITPFDANTNFIISKFSHKNQTDAIKDIKNIVKKSGVNLYKLGIKSGTAHKEKIIYPFIGNSQTFNKYVKNGSYLNFDPTLKFQIVNTDDENYFISGFYLLQGENKNETIALLKNSGFDISQYTKNGDDLKSQIVFFVLDLKTPLAVLFFAILLGMSYSTIKRFKLAAIKQIHGFSKKQILLSEIGEFSLSFLFISVIVGGFSFIFLLFFNHLNQCLKFYKVSAFLLLFLFAFLLCIRFCIFIFYYCSNQVNLIKGNQNLTITQILTSVLFSLILLLSFITVFTVSKNFESLSKKYELSKTWQQNSDYNFFLIQTIGDEEKENKLGEYAYGQDLQGVAVLCDRGYDFTVMPDNSSYTPGKSLIVNNKYLQENPVFDTNNKRIENLPEKSGEAYALIPTTQKNNEQLIKKSIDYFIQAQLNLYKEYYKKPSNIVPKVNMLYRKSSDMFNYDSGLFIRSNIGGETLTLPMIKDPILLVIPARSGLLLPAWYYGNIVSSEEIVFKKSISNLKKEIKAEGVDSVVQTVENASYYASVITQKNLNGLIKEVTSLIFMIIITLCAIFISVATHCDRKKKILFIGSVFGFSFLENNIFYLAFLILQSFAMLTLAINISGGSGESFFTGLCVCFAVVVCNMIFSVMALASHQNKFQAKYIKGY